MHILKTDGSNSPQKTDESLTLNSVKSIPGYSFCFEENGKYLYLSPDGTVEKYLSKKKALMQMKVTLGEVQKGKIPLGTRKGMSNLLLALPYRAAAQYQLQDKIDDMDLVDYYMEAKNHRMATKEIEGYLSSGSIDHTTSFGVGGKRVSVMDWTNNKEVDKVSINIIDTFSYGFIILISLISLANVFNTISTNIQLRRQEFAMLISVGMSRKGFDRMMNYECMLYGFKILLYGIPVSILLSWLMYHSDINNMNDCKVAWVFPWQGIIITTVSVFISIFATMIYAKVKRDNPMENLKNENY